MFASTKQARAILRLAFKEADCQVSHTYTEKTSDRDLERRSVVFPCYGSSEKVLKVATKLFKEFGYNESIPKLTSPEIYYSPEYIRVIAYID